MQLVRRVSEEDVLASWVRAESASDRFAPSIRAAQEKGASTPAEILALARGWPDRGYFDGFPPDVEWWEGTLSPAELLEVRYIDWDYWLDVSGGSRLPVDAIARMGWDAGEGLLPHQVEPIIVVRDQRSERVVVVEGHARLTNFVISRERLPGTIGCFLGISAHFDEWGCY